MLSLKTCLEKEAYEWMGYLILDVTCKRYKKFWNICCAVLEKKKIDVAKFLWNEQTGFQPTPTNENFSTGPFLAQLHMFPWAVIPPIQPWRRRP